MIELIIAAFGLLMVCCYVLINRRRKKKREPYRQLKTLTSEEGRTFLKRMNVLKKKWGNKYPPRPMTAAEKKLYAIKPNLKHWYEQAERLGVTIDDLINDNNGVEEETNKG